MDSQRLCVPAPFFTVAEALRIHRYVYTPPHGSHELRQQGRRTQARGGSELSGL